MGNLSQQPDQATVGYMGSAPQRPKQATAGHATPTLAQPDQATARHATQTLSQPSQATSQPDVPSPLVRVSQPLSHELSGGGMPQTPLMALQHDKAALQQPQVTICSALPSSQTQGQVATALVSEGPAGDICLGTSPPAIPLLPSSMSSAQQPVQATHTLPNPTAIALRSAMQLKSNHPKAELASKPVSQTPPPSRGSPVGSQGAGPSSEKKASVVSEPAEQTPAASVGAHQGRMGPGPSSDKAGMLSQSAKQTPAPSGGVLQHWLGAGMSSRKAPGTAEALAGVALFVNSLTPVTQVSFVPAKATSSSS